MEAAFFDLDKTVIAKASMVAFGRPLLDAGLIDRWLLARAMWSNLVFHWLGADEERMRKFRESALRLTRGWDQARIRALVADNLAEVIEPIVFDEAVDLIREHQAAGRRVFLISASPEEIVAPLARFLGVEESIATRARIDADGRYTGEVEFYSYGPYKAEAILELAEAQGIDLERSYAYSDSATDLPMMELVGHPVAVNPDRDLARAARVHDWEVLTFDRPVPLRSRVAMPRPVKAGVAAVVLAGTAGAAAVWWWRRRPAPPPPTLVARVRARTRTDGLRPATLAGRRTIRSGAARQRPPSRAWRRAFSQTVPPRGRNGDQAEPVSRRVRAWFRRRPAASSPPGRRGRGRRG
ncbi:MAG: HAD-IB family hydrolase [Acidimicrobiales bacterium]